MSAIDCAAPTVNVCVQPTVRAIRWSLAEPEMFGAQLRAILRASAHGKVRLLVPMVAQLSEVRQLFEAIERAKAQLRARGQAFVDVEVGAMIEVPAAALVLPMLLKHFDFVSIGTNDLIQYTLAIDRADESVSHLYDPWHPAVLQLVAQGMSNRAVAVNLECAESTVELHVTALLEKSHCDSRAHLVARLWSGI